MVLRCYAMGRGDQWEAFCLDLDLAVAGDSLMGVRAALESAIKEYVEQVVALPAEDQKRLIRRRAPLHEWLRYYWYLFLARWDSDKDDRHHEPFCVQQAV
jgi:hypothetical protein